MCMKNTIKKKQSDKKGPENNSSHMNEESEQVHYEGCYQIFEMDNMMGATSGSGIYHYGGPKLVPCY